MFLEPVEFGLYRPVSSVPSCNKARFTDRNAPIGLSATIGAEHKKCRKILLNFIRAIERYHLLGAPNLKLVIANDATEPIGFEENLTQLVGQLSAEGLFYHCDGFWRRPFVTFESLETRCEFFVHLFWPNAIGQPRAKRVAL